MSWKERVLGSARFHREFKRYYATLSIEGMEAKSTGFDPDATCVRMWIHYLKPTPEPNWRQRKMRRLINQCQESWARKLGARLMEEPLTLDDLTKDERKAAYGALNTQKGKYPAEVIQARRDALWPKGDEWEDIPF